MHAGRQSLADRQAGGEIKTKKKALHLILPPQQREEIVGCMPEHLVRPKGQHGRWLRPWKRPTRQRLPCGLGGCATLEAEVSRSFFPGLLRGRCAIQKKWQVRTRKRAPTTHLPLHASDPGTHRFCGGACGFRGKMGSPKILWNKLLLNKHLFAAEISVPYEIDRRQCAVVL